MALGNGKQDGRQRQGGNHEHLYRQAVQYEKAENFRLAQFNGLSLAEKNAPHRARPAAAAPIQRIPCACRELQLLGAPRDAVLRQGLRRVGEGTAEWEKPVPSNPLYAWYYQTQARFHEGGSAWSQWQNHFEKELGQHQTVLRGAGKDPAGNAFDTVYWPSAATGEYCQSRVYNTTLCALMLEVTYRYLPMYQSAAIPPEPLAYADNLTVTVQ